MARWRNDSDPLPERLGRYVHSEWKHEPDPVGAWGRAARRWLDDHPGRVLPWASDPVEILQKVVEVKLELARTGINPGPVWRNPVGAGQVAND